MKWEGKSLAHVLHHSAAVYFVLNRIPQRDVFLWALAALRARAGPEGASGDPEEHWRAIESRLTGESRWDRLVKRPDDAVSMVERAIRRRATDQTVTNILRVRPFTSYTIDGLRYTVDVFNPANELEMSYQAAGEAVVALLFESTDPPSVGPARTQDRLVENRAFYEILKDLDGILQPEHVCGTEANTMMSVLWAYLDGRVGPSYRLWEFLFPLHVLKDPPIEFTGETRISGRLAGMLPDKEVKLAKVEDWGDGRVLIQTRAGLDAVISWEYFAVAKALGMTPVQQLVEGSAPPRTAAR
jgi:hypothetical protein